METAPLRAYLVDDEPLALERLERMLLGFDGLHIVGQRHPIQRPRSNFCAVSLSMSYSSIFRCRA